MKTRSFVKLTIGAELRTQIVVAIKIRGVQPTITRISGRSR